MSGAGDVNGNYTRECSAAVRDRNDFRAREAALPPGILNGSESTHCEPVSSTGQTLSNDVRTNHGLEATVSGLAPPSAVLRQ